MANEVKIPILVEIAQSVNELKKLQKQGNDTAKDLAGSFKAMGVAAAAAVSAFVGSAFVSFLKSAAAEAAETEENISRLSGALDATGGFSKQATANLADFADQIQKTTRFSDDAALSSLGYLASITNLTENGLKVATQAAIDLSSRLKIDLQTATQLVGKAANGEVGAFKRYGITIQEGATSAETFANALKVLQSRFGGSAAKDLETFNGLTASASNNFNDLIKSIGKIIINNPAFLRSLQDIIELFQKLSGLIDKNKDSIGKLVTGFGKFITETAKGIGRASDRLDLLFNDPSKFFNTANGGFIAEKIEAEVDAAAKKIKNGPKINLGDLLNVSSIELSAADKKALVKQISGGDLGIVLGLSADSKVTGLTKQEQAISGIASATASVLKGAQGAVKLASGLVSTFVDTLLPGLGGVAGQIFEVLAQGPEAVKAMINSFLDAVPVIIENVIFALLEAIPLLIEKIPDVISELISHIPEFIDAFVAALPKLVASFAGQMPFIATRLGIELAAQAPFIAVNFVNALVKEAPRFVSEMIKSIGGGVGGIGEAAGGFLGGIGDFFGFAEGGMVPAGFPNDSFPAKLTSGEFVANADLTKKLEALTSTLINGGGQSQNVTVNMVIGEKQLASAMLDLNQRGFRTA